MLLLLGKPKIKLTTANCSEKDPSAGMKSSPLSAHWQVLRSDADPVVEPVNENFICAHAPTIPEEDADFFPLKYNFSHTFNRPKFEGTTIEKVFGRRGKQRKDPKGKPVVTTAKEFTEVSSLPLLTQ